MRAFRAVFVALIALVFVYSTNRCAFAAAFLESPETCCMGEADPAGADRGLPCGGEKDCLPCVTLDSGVNLAALIPLAVPAPVWKEQCEFAALMRKLAETCVNESNTVENRPGAIPPPPWIDGLRKSLPVRGPSRAV